MNLPEDHSTLLKQCQREKAKGPERFKLYFSLKKTISDLMQEERSVMWVMS